MDNIRSLEQINTENIITDIFAYLKNKIVGSDTQLNKQYFVDSILALQATADSLIGGYTSPAIKDYMDQLFSGKLPAYESTNYAKTIYKLLFKKLSPQAKSLETKDLMSSLVKTLEAIKNDINDILNYYGYLFGRNSEKNVEVKNLKISATLIVGYITHASIFIQWAYNFFVGITSYQDRKSFMKFQINMLSSDKVLEDVALTISSVVARKQNDNLHNMIEKLKNTQNDVTITIATPDGEDHTGIDKYLPENILSKNDLFYLQGFEEAILPPDMQTDGKYHSGLIPNVLLNIGRNFYQLQHWFNEYHKSMRDFTAAKIEEYTLKKDAASDPEEIEQINRLIERYTDKNAEYNKKITDYIRKHNES